MLAVKKNSMSKCDAKNTDFKTTMNVPKRKQNQSRTYQQRLHMYYIQIKIFYKFIKINNILS